MYWGASVNGVQILEHVMWEFSHCVFTCQYSLSHLGHPNEVIDIESTILLISLRQVVCSPPWKCWTNYFITHLVDDEKFWRITFWSDLSICKHLCSPETVIMNIVMFLWSTKSSTNKGYFTKTSLVLSSVKHWWQAHARTTRSVKGRICKYGLYQ